MSEYNDQEISFGQWFLTLFISSIPIVGLIMMFVWAFGSSTPASKANWAKACLAWQLIMIVLILIISFIVGVILS